MARLSVEERIDLVIQEAAKDASADQTSRMVAEDLYEREQKLVEHFAREWSIEKLTMLIKNLRQKARRENDPQTLLGFTVPRTILLKNGKRLLFGAATLRKLRQFRALVWKDERNHKHPTVARLDKAIAVMEQYAPEKHGITYSEVLALETEKLGKKAGK